MRADAELIREHLENGSEEAFRGLVERHAGMVHGVALRIVHDAALADEIAQAVFILLARKAPTLPAGTVLAGWLHQTTRYVALGALRSERRRQQYHRDLASMNDIAGSTAAWDQIRPHLDESLGQLAARDRDAIVLRFLEDRSFAEVGAALGTSEAAAKMRVGRALDKLRRALGRHGVIMTAAALAPILAAQAAAPTSAGLLAQITGAAVSASAPAPNLLPLVNEAIKLMALQKLKSTLIAAALALLLIGGGVATLFLLPAQRSRPAVQPLLVTTFEPMAGEWDGTYETRTDDQPNPRRQRVALSIHTANQGRLCEIEMHLLDRNDQPVTTFHFSHALNDTGDRIFTTDDPNISRVRLEGGVTEALHNKDTREWRAAFHATRPDSADITECRWSRQDDELFISRLDVTETPQGSTRLSSELVLRPRSSKPRTAFNALPRGTQTFDRVTFNIKRPINIIGARAGRARGRELARVGDATIRGRGRNIHVLHTGDHGASASGDFIWRLVLHYADGGTERFDFAYDVHLRNYWRRAGDGPPTPSDPDTSLAWVGTSVESDRTGADLVVSRTTLNNPRPSVEVTGAEFVSLLGPSSAYVLAVTIGDDGPTPQGNKGRLAPDAPPLTFAVQSATAGQPQPETALDIEFECDGFSVRLGESRTDSTGRVIIDVPTQVVRAVQYKAHHRDGKVEEGGLEISQDEKEWPVQIIRFPE